MNGKIRIFAMVCVTLLTVGCENNTPSSTTEAMPTPVATEAAPTGTPPSASVIQAVIDPAQGAPAELSMTVPQINTAPEATVLVPVTVKNTSTVEFVTGNTENRIDFVSDVLGTDGKPLGRQVMPLSAPVAAGKTETYQVSIVAPAIAGQYTLDINLVQQGKFFFKDAGVKSVTVMLNVK